MDEKQETRKPLTHCPSCAEDIEPKWSVCPYCGLRLKPADDLVQRGVFWSIILLAFVVFEAWMAGRDQNAATGFGVLVGLPLAYVFGKAVLFRISGNPLTWKQLRQTTLRASLASFTILVVVPIAIGVSVLILAFAICSGFRFGGP